MSINRRSALALLGLGANAAALNASAAEPGGASFQHGVASGDPLSDRVIIWTRATPAAPQAKDFTVAWTVADAPDFKRVVASGQLLASAARDFTVKADVAGLKPDKDYWFRFSTGGVQSPVGRARTLAIGPVKDVALAVVSCSLYPAGYFNAYDAIAKLDRVDAVVHLGDYIYEYGGGPNDYGTAGAVKMGRLLEPKHEIMSLADYRLRHATYKSDPHLQAAHARAPWICVWDDHETANDSWLGGAENHSSDTEGDWNTRKANALRAYYEWMPLREPSAGGLAEAINRSFRFGDVAELVMVETRLLARSKQRDYAEMPMRQLDGKSVPDFTAFTAERADPSRQLLGDQQERWLAETLKASVADGCAWQILGNQVVMAQVKGPDLKAALPPAEWAAMLAGLPEAFRPRIEQMAALFAQGVPFNLDAWDGYPAARERLYAMIRAAKAQTIVLAGDSHAFWVNELHDAAGDRVAVEFGTTAVTSPGWGDFLPKQDMGKIIANQNDEVIYSHQSAKGFTLLTLTPDEARAELIAVSTITGTAYETKSLKRYRVAKQWGAGVEET